MGPTDREIARRRAERKLGAMRRHTAQLRRRVIAISVVGFVALWMVVLVQMATGNDPVLGSGEKATARSAANKSGSGPERRHPNAAVPPPTGEEGEGSPTVPEQIEAEQVETEQFETELREAEARELEELESVTTGQS